MAQTETDGLEVLETREWVDSLDYVLSKGGPNRAGRLLQQLALHARREAGINLPFSATTPYQNTISFAVSSPLSRQPGDGTPHQEPGSLECPGHGRPSQQDQEGIGGHISTFASAATLYEVAFNHFLRAQTESGDRDRLLPGARRAGNLFACLSRRPHFERKAAKLPPRTKGGRRLVVPIPIPG